jgi:hypothetical protein
LFFANVGGKCSGEQVSRSIVAQWIGSRTDVRAVAANLSQPIVELGAAGSVTVEVVIIAILSGVAVPE